MQYLYKTNNRACGLVLIPALTLFFCTNMLFVWLFQQKITATSIFIGFYWLLAAFIGFFTYLWLVCPDLLIFFVISKFY
jgi:hypothetical protein